MLVLSIQDDKSLTNELVINSFEDLLLSMKKQIVMLMGVIYTQKILPFERARGNGETNFDC